eukprot:TRINITY_DN3230_c0_g1_i2.p1 TRINITY_DN3230_c0_g1~~TRINITY_DN3230_c0_g1_i2.p1  ORF type:complete len:333 (-),score=47.63 TRINITY_DN3230_c0_g1_i2:239-1237(-)
MSQIGKSGSVAKRKSGSKDVQPSKKPKSDVSLTPATTKTPLRSAKIAASGIPTPKETLKAKVSLKPATSAAVKQESVLPRTVSAKATIVKQPVTVSSSLSGNWLQLQKALGKKPTLAKKQTDAVTSAQDEGKVKREFKKLPLPISEDRSVTKYVALDCEMVGVENGESMLGRVCIVNSYGNVVYDKYVLPQEEVLDYRTRWSGIQKHHLTPDNAVAFKQVQTEVAEIIKDRIVVGHALHNDFKVLFLSHPWNMIRDTAKYRPLMRKRNKPHALKNLVRMHLGAQIQGGEHEPDEDARAALLLYKMFKKDWEQSLRSKKVGHRRSTTAEQKGN